MRVVIKKSTESNNTKKRIFIFLCFALNIFLFSPLSLMSQSTGNSYKNALGVKAYPTGITFKHFGRSSAAIEVIGYFYNRGSRLTVLYEYHGRIGDGGLRWYVGPGAHVAFYNSKFFGGGETIGVDGVLGLDYKFRGAPINLSIDWQPSLEFGDYAGFSAGWGGFAARFAF